MNETLIREQTINWIRNVVVGCNFCPFASRALQQQSIRYRIIGKGNLFRSLDALQEELSFLDQEKSTETTLIIFSSQFQRFPDYLQLLKKSEQLLRQQGYQGVYQIASFHPQYVFEDALSDDPANYTNRSPYPMLHLLREASLSNALTHYPNPEQIPGRNMAYAREQGLAAMQLLLKNCEPG